MTQPPGPVAVLLAAGFTQAECRAVYALEAAGYAIIHREHGVTEEMGRVLEDAMPGMDLFARRSWISAAIEAAPRWTDRKETA